MEIEQGPFRKNGGFVQGYGITVDPVPTSNQPPLSATSLLSIPCFLSSFRHELQPPLVCRSVQAIPEAPTTRPAYRVASTKAPSKRGSPFKIYHRGPRHRFPTPQEPTRLYNNPPFYWDLPLFQLAKEIFQLPRLCRSIQVVPEPWRHGQCT